MANESKAFRSFLKITYCCGLDSSPQLLKLETTEARSGRQRWAVFSLSFDRGSSTAVSGGTVGAISSSTIVFFLLLLTTLAEIQSFRPVPIV
jgi:hypothetical protein